MVESHERALGLIGLLIITHSMAPSQGQMVYDIATQCPLLANRVHLFGTINAGSPGPEAAIFDWNRNGKMDIILSRTNTTPFRTEIYEYDGADSFGMARFNVVYSFPFFFSQSCGSIPCPPYVVATGDLTGNGLMDLVSWSAIDTLRVFEQPDSNSFPTQRRFRFDFRTTYVPQGEIGDFDRDGKKELLVNRQGAHLVFEYQTIDSSVMLVWRDSVRVKNNWTYNYGRYALGDFDGDGHMEFAGGNSHPPTNNDAFVFVYENAGDNQFALTWSDTIQGVIDLWVHGSGGDLDSSGRVEFWVGGYVYTDRTLYKFYMYEATGNNTYDSVFVLTVRLPYLGTASIGEIAFGDVDGDGKQEIALGTGDYVLVLKSTGPHLFEPIACIPTGTGDSEIWLRDIDGDGKAEIIVSGGGTRFYKYDGPTAVSESQNGYPSGIELMQNYPNPFNSSTRVRYTLSSRLHVQMAIYNILGQKIAVLIDASQEAGSHSFEIDSDKYGLATGLYFLRLSTPTTSLSKKVLLLR